MKTLSQRDFSNILIIKPSSLGDVLRCVPILYGLRRRYRHARISWLVRPEWAPILRPLSQLDEIIEFDRVHFGRIAYRPAAARDFIRFIGSLRRKNFDLVLDIQGLFRSGFLARCTAATVRLGFANARELAWCFYTHRITIDHGRDCEHDRTIDHSRDCEHNRTIDHKRDREHIVESYWRFAHALGFGSLEKEFSLSIDPATATSARELLSQAGFSHNRPYVVMLIGGSESAKRWPAERFAALAEKMYKCYDMVTVLLGAGPAENVAAGRVVSRSSVEIINLVDSTDLSQIVAILKNAALVVGNDSGPLHLAAALSVPLVGLYGPTDPVVVGPYGQADGVVQAGADQPRRRRYSSRAEHRMENITLEQVCRAVSDKLARPM